MTTTRFLLGAAVLLGLVATAQPAAALGGTFYLNGFSYSWRKQDTVSGARKIAACNAYTIYALNWDKSLWVNRNGGGAKPNGDYGWSYVDTPWAAEDIACDKGTLYALNADRSLWVWGGSGWSYVNTLGAAVTLQSGGGDNSKGYSGLWAMNYDDSVWSSSNLYAGTWYPHGYASGALRVTAAPAETCYGSQTSYPSRGFALNADSLPANTGPIWYSPNPLTSNPTWSQLNTGGLDPIEISAASSTILYILTSNYELWTAYFSEENLTDGVDNDQDGLTDDECVATAEIP